MSQPLRAQRRAEQDKEWRTKVSLSSPPRQIRKGLKIQRRISLDSSDLIFSESKEGALW